MLINSLQDSNSADVFLRFKVKKTLTFTLLRSFALLVTSWAPTFKGAHCIDAVSSLAYPWDSLAFINICKKKVFLLIFLKRIEITGVLKGVR